LKTGLTGVGYIHEDNYADNYPPKERETIWNDYLRLSAIYRARINASVLSTFAEMETVRLRRFAGLEGIQAIFANWLSSMDMAENSALGLGPDYVPVRPDHLAVLYRQAQG
jgi:hypothetical protein